MFPQAHGIVCQAGVGGPPAPAKTWTDFSEYTTGQAPSDWSRFHRDDGTGAWTIEEVEGAIGGKVLRFTFGDSNPHGLRWDSAELAEDCEVLVKFRAGSNQNIRGAAAIRYRQISAAFDVFVYGTSSNNTAWAIRSYDPSEEFHASGSFSWSADTWYWVRLRGEGTTFRLRVWADGDPEPETWLAQATQSDADLQEPGGFGVYTRNAAGEGEVHEWDWFSYAVDGGTAPGPS